MNRGEQMENELYHYGVKGMQWGVRRSPRQLGHDIAQRERSKKQIADKSKEKIKQIKTSTRYTRKQQRERINDIKKSEVNDVKRIDAKYAIKKYGGKKEAINAQVKKSNIRSAVKKGSLYIASIASTTSALNIAMTSGVAKGLAITGKLAVDTMISGPIGAVSLAALGIGSSIAAGKVKSRLTKNERSKIEYIKRDRR